VRSNPNFSTMAASRRWFSALPVTSKERTDSPGCRSASSASSGLAAAQCGQPSAQKK